MRKRIITNFIFLSITATSIVPAYGGWNPTQTETAKEQDITNTRVAEVIANFKNNYPNLKVYFEKAYGYAVFPTVTKGGIGIGAAHGKGEVYEEGTLIGTTSLTQITIGAQFGGQSYSEIIFFKDKETLDDFKAGNYKLGAQASAVAATSGVSKDADYSEGVAVFTLSKSGLMYEASIGGQKFSFQAK
ncbi:MAG: YSC84-related protein [Candidatus Brocadia sp.]|nr:YSC84-related protein [Candidatus Brocadia sp.]